MHQRDYILRIIEQLGVALAAIRRRIMLGEKAGEVSEALARTAGQAGLDLDLMRGFDLDTLRLFIMPTGEVEPARCWLMAEILYLDGLEARLSDRPAEDSLSMAELLARDRAVASGWGISGLVSQLRSPTRTRSTAHA